MSGVLAYTLVVRHPDTYQAVALLEGKPVPDWAANLVHQGDLVGGSASQGYAASTVEDLKREIDGRNEGREDDAKLSKSGNKADLIAALEADDAASADSPE